MYEIVTVSGIRPDFIRYSKIWELLDSDPEINHTLIHTGQHFDDLLSGVFFEELEIRKPDFNLEIGAIGRDHIGQTSLLLTRMVYCLKNLPVDPDLVVFLGDTNSVTVVPFLRKEGFKLAHIEAGMRSYDYDMPEEINRVCCDHNCHLLFTYHQNYKNNLIGEGINRKAKIVVTGNTIKEVCLPYARSFKDPTEDFILLDVHRHENLISADRYRWILNYAASLGSIYGIPVRSIEFPRALQLIHDHKIDTKGIDWVPLMSYKNFLRAQFDAKFMISDSGTAQEEALFFNTPVLVPRSSTERPESLWMDCSIMVDANKCLSSQIYLANKYLKRVEGRELWMMNSWLGDGNTAQRIVSGIKDWVREND